IEDALDDDGGERGAAADAEAASREHRPRDLAEPRWQHVVDEEADRQRAEERAGRYSDDWLQQDAPAERPGAEVAQVKKDRRDEPPVVGLPKRASQPTDVADLPEGDPEEEGRDDGADDPTPLEAAADPPRFHGGIGRRGGGSRRHLGEPSCDCKGGV